MADAAAWRRGDRVLLVFDSPGWTEELAWMRRYPSKGAEVEAVILGAAPGHAEGDPDASALLRVEGVVWDDSDPLYYSQLVGYRDTVVASASEGRRYAEDVLFPAGSGSSVYPISLDAQGNAVLQPALRGEEALLTREGNVERYARAWWYEGASMGSEADAGWTTAVVKLGRGHDFVRADELRREIEEDLGAYTEMRKDDRPWRVDLSPCTMLVSLPPSFIQGDEVDAMPLLRRAFAAHDEAPGLVDYVYVSGEDEAWAPTTSGLEDANDTDEWGEYDMTHTDNDTRDLDTERAERRARLAQAVVAYRRLHGLSQERMAEEAGLSRMTLGRVERQERDASADTLYRLERYAGRTMLLAALEPQGTRGTPRDPLGGRDARRARERAAQALVWAEAQGAAGNAGISDFDAQDVREMALDVAAATGV